MANGSTQLALVSAYVPAIVARDVGRAGAGGPPRSRPLRAAVLLVDISGFTAVAEQLCQRGPGGIEELSTTINSCFGRILDVIAAHGGEVLRFAGDALIVLWEVDVGDQAALAEASLRASACGLGLRPVLADSATAYGHALALRIGISAGDLLALHVGGEVAGGQRDLVVGGPAIVEIGEAERRATPGQVVVAPSLYELAHGRLQGKALDGGFFVVEALVDAPDARPAPAVSSDGADLATLGGYLPAGLLDRLSGAGSAWQAELRRVSVLFLHLPDVDFSQDGVAELVHGAFVATQRVVIQAGGTINQFVIDDKGAVMVIAWGLPASAHEDDPLRAARAALGITKALRGIGLGASIGVTTGRAYCGDRGNGARREYALIGDTVNVAARLMGASAGAALESALTGGEYRGRVLGVSENVHAEIRTTWIMTANNPQLGEEMARRCVRIRLDADRTKQQGAAGYTIPEIKTWTKDHRADLVHAVLTLLSSWLEAGMPPTTAKGFESFESWTRVLASLLGHLGIQGLLTTDDDDDDEGFERREGEPFCADWFERFGREPVKPGDLLPLIMEGHHLEQAIPGEWGTRALSGKLGAWLATMKGRKFGRYTVVRATARKGHGAYKLATE